MEIYTGSEEIKENKIIGNPILKDSKVTFAGTNNILYCENNVQINSSNLDFKCNNSIIYLSESKHPYKLKVDIYENCTLAIGKNNYINQKITFIIDEEKNVIIGDDCMFSLGLFFRTSDVHIIYDISSKKRINTAKSILIGDHVWLGQDVLVLKGTQVGSGTIIGASSVTSNKKYLSNCMYAGNKMLRSNVVFDGISSHKFTAKDNQKYDTVNDEVLNKYNYQTYKEGFIFDKIDETLSSSDNVDEKLKVISDIYKENKARFAINE